MNMEFLTSRGALDEKQCAQAISAMDAHLASMPEPSEVMHGEKMAMMNVAIRVACGERSYSDLSRKGKPGGDGKSVMDGLGVLWRWSGAAFEDARVLEQGFDRMISCMDLPPDERKARLDALTSEVRAISTRRRIGGDRFFYGIAMPSLLSAASTLRCGESSVLVCRTGLACQLHKFRTGEYPKSLEDLGKPTQDPHRTGPLSYEKTAEGFKLWGIGADYEDSKGTKPMDDVFEIGR